MAEWVPSSHVELGFLETTASWRLKSKYFPSKVGGKPAWLNLRDLPDTRCSVCGKPMTFLLQVYAPVPDDDSCFHRTLFVYFCENPKCCRPNDASSFAAFRCQLPRKNEFYAYEPPIENENESGPTAADHSPYCVVCGGRAPKRCSRCRTLYCSKEHQKRDWRAGHRELCGKEAPGTVHARDTSAVILLPEFEICTETEESDDEEQEEEEANCQTQAERMAEYEKHVQDKTSEGGLLKPEDVRDLEEMAATTSDGDKCFRRFRKQIDLYPEQVLRYQRGGTPLWVSSQSMPSIRDVPDCSCGAARQFEFQILPQLLNHLKLDSVGASVDWGTIAVYTCDQSCTSETRAYHPEFVWKQDYSFTTNSVAAAAAEEQ